MRPGKTACGFVPYSELDCAEVYCSHLLTTTCVSPMRWRGRWIEQLIHQKFKTEKNETNAEEWVNKCLVKDQIIYTKRTLPKRTGAFFFCGFNYNLQLPCIGIQSSNYLCNELATEKRTIISNPDFRNTNQGDQN